MAFLEVNDLSSFADIDASKAQDMIDDATAMAVLVAPSLADEDELTAHQKAAVKAILRGAILRWNEAGSGALQSQTAGPFGQTYDNRQQRRGMFWPSEIDQLKAVVQTAETSGAFSIDTVGCSTAIHADICSINFGATYCSCGAWLTNSIPLYERDW